MKNVLSKEEFQDTFDNMVGGLHRFFSDNWRKQTLYLENRLPRLKGFYNSSQFLQDYENFDYHETTLIVDLYNGKRRTKYPKSMEAVRSERGSNSSLIVQSLKIPNEMKGLPSAWNWFLSFYQHLCLFCLPGFPPENKQGGAVSAVDIFQTNGMTSVGGHYDTGDVFYFVLEGEKEWVVECQPDMDCSNKLTLEEGFTTSDYQPTKEYMTVTVKPGDLLYVPPFTYHRVVSKSQSLAVSVGLPAFNELSFAKHILEKIKDDHLPLEPLPSYPTQFVEMEEAAKEVRYKRMKRILNTIESELP